MDKYIRNRFSDNFQTDGSINLNKSDDIKLFN